MTEPPRLGGRRRPDASDEPDLYEAGWAWCSTNRRWLPRDGDGTRCPGCGLVGPPPTPVPWRRRDG
jgi:hypothetical protein